jgi:putative glycosyltransferase (TIGR04372 family)
VDSAIVYLKRVARTVALAIAVLFLVVLRSVSRILRVRLIVVGFHRFGHLALEPEQFLARSQSKQTRFQLDLWSLGNHSNQTNRYLANKWASRVNAVPSWIVDALVRAGDRFPRLACDRPQLSIHGPANGLDRTAPQLSFTPEEIASGSEQLRALGIDPSRPYVCLIVRDSSHYQSLGHQESPGYSFLNCDISTFHETAVALVNSGYQVLRMGAGSERELGLKHPGVVDYAKSSLRSEFLDVYIAGTCAFAVSTQTGPDAVCLAFRRPVFYVDVVRFSQFFFGTKIAWWNPATIMVNGKRMSLRQIVNHEVFWLEDPDDFIRYGISIERSSPSEIARMALAFADVVQSGLQMPAQHAADAEQARRILKEGLGDRGHAIFGEPTAMMNPAFLADNARWFLNE